MTCRLAAIPSCHVGVLVLTPLPSFYILFVYQRLDAFLIERGNGKNGFKEEYVYKGSGLPAAVREKSPRSFPEGSSGMKEDRESAAEIEAVPAFHVSRAVRKFEITI